VCVCVCARARAYMRVCVRACVHACLVCVCEGERDLKFFPPLFFKRGQFFFNFKDNE